MNKVFRLGTSGKEPVINPHRKALAAAISEHTRLSGLKEKQRSAIDRATENVSQALAAHDVASAAVEAAREQRRQDMIAAASGEHAIERSEGIANAHDLLATADEDLAAAQAALSHLKSSAEQYDNEIANFERLRKKAAADFVGDLADQLCDELIAVEENS